MNPEKNQEESVTLETNATGEGGIKDVVTIAKSDYDNLNQTVGSLKRELKDLKKSFDEKPKESSKNDKLDENQLLQKLEKMSLRHAGINHADDIELARTTAKKWNMDLDEVLADEDFRVKLEKQQTARANVEATSGVKGDKSGISSKLTAEYWIAKGAYPTKQEVPDRTVRSKIRESMISSAKGNNRKFYND